MGEKENHLNDLQQDDADELALSQTSVGLRNCLTFFLIWIFLISCFFLFFVNVIYLEDSPSASQWLSFFRMLLFGVLYIGAAVVVGRAIWSDLSWKMWVFSSVSLIFFDVGAILGTAAMYNLVNISNYYFYWGWVFPVLRCFGNVFCGLQQADVLWWGILMNVVFFSSFWIVLLNAFQYFGKKSPIFIGNKQGF